MIGEKIHTYEINAHLGKGGMGNVYRATDTMLGREVALKMLHPQLTVESQFLERFKKEARVLAQLLHPNIAVIYNFSEQDGNHFMVMEYVEGTNLDDLLKMRSTLSPEFVVPVCIQALEGLQHAHKKNIFHRDIKPANIMLTPDGTIKLMDFGIAKVAGEQKMTQVNKIVGTVEFMAPELIQGKDASAASDIYSMGVTLYELISGKLPFAADTDFSLMQAIMKERVISPDKINSSTPKALSNIIMKALEKNPENRFANAYAFQQALIAAFPGYRNADLSAMMNPAPALQATRIAAQPAATGQYNQHGGMQTRANIWAKPMPGVEKAKAHVSKHKTKYITVAALLLFLFIVITVFKPGTTPTGETEIVEGTTNSGGIVDNNTQGSEKTGPVDRTVTVPVEEKKSEKNTEKEAEKKSEKTKPKTPDNSKGLTVVDEPVEEKPVEKKRDVYIKSKVEVDVYLQNDLGNAQERQDIPVSFRVTNNVYYEGVIIVNKGATVSGTIKLGKMMTDIDMFNVTAANGAQISVKAQKNHGRRKDITSDRTYTALILPGTRINF